MIFPCDICGAEICVKPRSACEVCKSLIASVSACGGSLRAPLAVCACAICRSIPCICDRLKSEAMRIMERFRAELVTAYATEPLVKPERRVAIESFRTALERVCEAYGVTVRGDTDMSGDILIFDQLQNLPDDYDWSARIDRDGLLDFAEWVLDDESEATRQ